MYTGLPYFVFGFHGCDQATKEAVLHGKVELTPSTNNYDWLGSGIYFWEQNEKRAMDFAMLSHKNPGKYTTKPIEAPAVIGAVIDLGFCMNLMDSAHISQLEVAYSQLEEITKETGAKMPTNKGKGEDKPLRILDRAVIEMTHELMKQSGVRQYDSVRGLFLEGPLAYPGAGFRKETHIQICVRNIDCIKAYFDPREKADRPFLV